MEGLLNFEFHANPNDYLDLTNVFRKWPTMKIKFRNGSLGPYSPATLAGKKQLNIYYIEKEITLELDIF